MKIICTERKFIFQPNRKWDWMKDFAQVPTILELDNVLRVFFTCRPNADSNNLQISYIGYVDLDRFNPEKVISIGSSPIIGLGSLGTFDQFGTMPGSIIKRDNVIYLYYTGWKREVELPYSTSIGILKSIDNGCTFSRIAQGPCLGLNLYDPYLVNGPFVIQEEKQYTMFYSSCYKWVKNGEKLDPVYLIKQAFSSDGFNWLTSGEFCIPQVLNEEAQNRPMIFNYDGDTFMIFSYRSSKNFREHDGYRIGLAKTNNMIDWERCDYLLEMDSVEDSWDSQMQAYPFIYQNGNEIFLFYNGNNFGKDGFGFAKLKFIK